MNIQSTPIIEQSSKCEFLDTINNKSIIINKLLKILETYNLIYNHYKNTKEENILTKI